MLAIFLPKFPTGITLRRLLACLFDLVEVEFYVQRTLYWARGLPLNMFMGTTNKILTFILFWTLVLVWLGAKLRRFDCLGSWQFIALFQKNEQRLWVDLLILNISVNFYFISFYLLDTALYKLVSGSCCRILNCILELGFSCCCFLTGDNLGIGIVKVWPTL